MGQPLPEPLAVIDCLAQAWQHIREENPSALPAFAGHLAEQIQELEKPIAPDMALQWADQVALARAKDRQQHIPSIDRVLAAILKACPPWQGPASGFDWGWRAAARWADGQWESEALLPALLADPAAPSGADLSGKLVDIRQESSIRTPATLLGWALCASAGESRHAVLFAALQKRGLDVNVPVTQTGLMALSTPGAAKLTTLRFLLAAGADPLRESPQKGVPASLQWLFTDTDLEPHMRVWETVLLTQKKAEWVKPWFAALDRVLPEALADPADWRVKAKPVLKWAQRMAAEHGQDLPSHSVLLARQCLQNARTPVEWKTLLDHAEHLTELLPGSTWNQPEKIADDRAWCWLAACQKKGSGGSADAALLASALNHLGTLPVGPMVWNGLRAIRTNTGRFDANQLEAVERAFFAKVLQDILDVKWDVTEQKDWLGSVVHRALGRLHAVLHRPADQRDPNETGRHLTDAWLLAAFASSRQQGGFEVLKRWSEQCSSGALPPTLSPDRSRLSEALASRGARVREARLDTPLAAAWRQSLLQATMDTVEAVPRRRSRRL